MIITHNITPAFLYLALTSSAVLSLGALSLDELSNNLSLSVPLSAAIIRMLSSSHLKHTYQKEKK